VSLVNWTDEPAPLPETFTIDGVDVAGIGPDLRDRIVGAWTPLVLAASRGRCFQGPIPVGAGFIVSAAEADAQNDRDLVARLTDLNRQISTGELPYQPFD